MNPPILILAVLFGILTMSGCATVTRGTTEQLKVQSEPAGAAVRLSNGFTGITPATFTIPRKGEVIVTISKEGYDTSEVTVSTHVAGAGTAGFIGNALIGGIIGGGVDIATGATLSHTPNPVMVTLKPTPERPPTSPPSAADVAPPVAPTAVESAETQPAAPISNAPVSQSS